MRIRLRREKFGRWREFCNWIDVTGKLCTFGRNFEWQSSRKIFIESERPLSPLFFRIATRREYISSGTADVCNDIDIKSIKVGRRNLLKSLTKTRREMLL